MKVGSHGPCGAWIVKPKSDDPSGATRDGHRGLEAIFRIRIGLLFAKENITNTHIRTAGAARRRSLYYARTSSWYISHVRKCKETLICVKNAKGIATGSRSIYKDGRFGDWLKDLQAIGRSAASRYLGERRHADSGNAISARLSKVIAYSVSRTPSLKRSQQSVPDRSMTLHRPYRG